MSIGLAVWDSGFSLFFEFFIAHDRISWYNKDRLRIPFSDIHRYDEY